MGLLYKYDFNKLIRYSLTLPFSIELITWSAELKAFAISSRTRTHISVFFAAFLFMGSTISCTEQIALNAQTPNLKIPTSENPSTLNAPNTFTENRFANNLDN